MNNATWYYETGSTSTEITASVCSGQSGYNCSIGNGVLLHQSNGSYDYTLTVTWNGENITTGVLSQSNNNGDHKFRFYLHYGVNNSDVERNRYHTVAGTSILLDFILFAYVIQFQDQSLLLWVWSVKLIPKSLSIGLHLIYQMLMDM